MIEKETIQPTHRNFTDEFAFNRYNTNKPKVHNNYGIIGENYKIQELISTLSEIAKLDLPVLIQGEEGTGKELTALAIHNHGLNSRKPFFIVNCGEYKQKCLERELFGFAKGAFPGAQYSRQGILSLVRGGTLFFNEITYLPLGLQCKILQVLKNREMKKLGSDEPEPVNMQIISSSTHNPKEEVDKGTFLRELYYRISIVPIILPPLRNRKEDIPLLVDYFLDNAFYAGQKALGISKKTLATLMNYAWPGNILELKSVIHYALIRSKGEEIQSDHLPFNFINHLPLDDQDCSGRSSTVGRRPKLNRERVKLALTQSKGNKVRAARILCVGRATLYKFLASHKDLKNIKNKEMKSTN